MTALTSLLERFFGEGNDLRWQEAKSHQALEPFLAQAVPDWKRLVLPRIQQDAVTWYALARDARSARILREELQAFVVPSYAAFAGFPPDSSDPVEQAILDFAERRHVLKLRVVDPNQKKACQEALSRLARLWQRIPRGVRQIPRPAGRVLRDFELAMTSGARSEASAYLEELRSLGGISSRNLLFLRIYLHETFDEWHALYDLLDEGAIVQAKRPRRVTRALIRAVYRRELARYEEETRPQDALRHFRQEILPRFGRLYRSLAALECPEVTKSFLLAAAAAEPPQVERRNTLLEVYPAKELDRPYVEALARLVPETPIECPTSPLDKARKAFMGGDLDRAFILLTQAEPSAVSLELLIRCAAEVGSLTAASGALEILDHAASPVREALQENPRLRRQIDTLKEMFSLQRDEEATPPIPQGWHEWLNLIRLEPEWSGAVAVAAEGALEWPVNGLETSPTEWKDFAETLRRDLPAPAAETLSSSLPHLIEFFVNRASPSRAVTPVQRALLDRLLYEETRSLESIRASGKLLEALMRGGIGPDECTSMLEDIAAAWSEQPSFELLDWALDLLESLVLLQVAPHQAQQQFTSQLLGEVVRWRERLLPGQIALFEQLCNEGGFPFDAERYRPATEQSAEKEAAIDPLVERLRGKVVALYSLRTKVLERVRGILLSLHPEAQVRLFSDKVGNPALRSAARGADIFLIVTGAATHAATTFIEDHRPPDAVTLRCHSTGAASMLRLLAEH